MSAQTSPRAARALTVGAGVLMFVSFAPIAPFMSGSFPPDAATGAFAVAAGTLFGLGGALIIGQVVGLADGTLEAPGGNLLPGVDHFAAGGAFSVAGFGATSASFALAPAYGPSLLAGAAAGAVTYLPLAFVLPEA